MSKPESKRPDQVIRQALRVADCAEVIRLLPMTWTPALQRETFHVALATEMHQALALDMLDERQLAGLCDKAVFLARLIALRPSILRSVVRKPKARVSDKTVLLAFRYASRGQDRVLAGEAQEVLQRPSVLAEVLADPRLAHVLAARARQDVPQLLAQVQSCEQVQQVAERAFLNAESRDHQQLIASLFTGTPYMQVLAKHLEFRCST